MNPTQQKILHIVKAKGRVTSSEISTDLRLTHDTAGRNLRLLVDMGYIHVAGQDDSKSRMPSNVYAVGTKDSVEPVKKQNKTDQSEASQALSDTALQYLKKHNARFVSQDFRMNHAEHVRFMTKFQSHPDPASEWLFNEPKVELLGAKYERTS